MNTELRSAFATAVFSVVDEGKLNVTFSGVLVEFSLDDGSSSGGSFRIESFIVLLPVELVAVEAIAGNAEGIVLKALVVMVAESAALFAPLSTASVVEAALEMNGDVTL